MVAKMHLFFTYNVLYKTSCRHQDRDSASDNISLGHIHNSSECETGSSFRRIGKGFLLRDSAMTAGFAQGPSPLIRIIRIEPQYTNLRLVPRTTKPHAQETLPIRARFAPIAPGYADIQKDSGSETVAPVFPWALLTWVIENQITWQEICYFVGNEWGKEMATLAMPWGVVETFPMRWKTAHRSREAVYPASSLVDMPASGTPWVQDTEVLFTRAVCFLTVKRRGHKPHVGDRGNSLHRRRTGTPLMDSSLKVLFR